MLDSKLTKLKELIEQKERIDRELAVILGETTEAPRAKRGRKPRVTITEATPPQE